MRDFILICAVAAEIIFGFHIMKDVDNFLFCKKTKKENGTEKNSFWKNLLPCKEKVEGE